MPSAIEYIKVNPSYGLGRRQSMINIYEKVGDFSLNVIQFVIGGIVFAAVMADETINSTTLYIVAIIIVLILFAVTLLLFNAAKNNNNNI